MDFIINTLLSAIAIFFFLLSLKTGNIIFFMFCAIIFYTVLTAQEDEYEDDSY